MLSLLDPGALRARFTGKSFWQVRYSNGRVISEWEGIDWIDIPRMGMNELRLICPSGEIAVMGNTRDATDRLFQVHGGILTMGAGRRTTYQLIGLIVGSNGACQCAAWEYDRHRLVTFDDNFKAMRYETIGKLSDILILGRAQPKQSLKGTTAPWL